MKRTSLRWIALTFAALSLFGCSERAEPTRFEDLDNSRATKTPGQSMQPGSPFYGNLLPLWGAETYFPLLYSRSRVEERTTHRLLLRP